MPSHFSNFPVVAYKISEAGQRTLMTNIARRFVLRQEVLSRKVLFEPYTVSDGERPDIVAYKYYDDPKLDWLVMIANQLIHPQFDWFMGYHDFKAYMIGKYGSAEAAHQTVHHYEEMVLEKRLISNGIYTEELWLEVDAITYGETPEDRRRTVSVYKYEDQLNKARQNIQLVHKSFVGRIEREVELMLRNG